MSDIDDRIMKLERQLSRQRIALGTAGLVFVAATLTAFAAPGPKMIETQAIRIVDSTGKPRILIGAPPPLEGRKRTDAQTASIVVLGPDGADRVIVGEAPNPYLEGKTYPRIGAAYGLVIHQRNGSERGGMTNLDNGRSVVALDRAGGDAVAMVVNEKSGFAGLTVNYESPLGRYAEAWRIGTKGDEAWLSMQDRAEGERARLSTVGNAAPTLVTRPAGAPPAP